jgi:hypothetical protein
MTENASKERFYCISVSAAIAQFDGTHAEAEQHLNLVEKAVKDAITSLGLTFMQRELMVRTKPIPKDGIDAEIAAYNSNGDS